MLKEKVIETIKKHNLINDGDRIVCGVSGGPDSISMLNILKELKQDNYFKFDICVAHINHGLRENAKIDEQYVLDYCKKNGIECFVLNTNIKDIAEKEKRGLEETGRIVRYEFFDEILNKTNSNKIAIAHNSNDNVETILMNIIRGTGLSGLKGIEAKSGKYIRPLIEAEREEIEKYCEEEKLNPRHDESNDENIYTRNKIRNIAIPYIKEELNPNFLETITRLSEIVKDDLEYLELQTKSEYKDMCLEEKNITENVYNGEKEATIILDLKKFNSQNKAIQKRIILYSINKIFGTTKGIEKVHIEDIIKLCNNNIGNKFLTPNKKTKIVIKNKKIYIMGLK
ncbi:MAG: tRNA lysidine(34) synthetase TilS [Clostridia bacterium]|nr:tRNA lysidine(34) synthetase TilS [Clostridia bacterium]